MLLTCATVLWPWPCAVAWSMPSSSNMKKNSCRPGWSATRMGD